MKEATYTPDRWVILEIIGKDDEPVYKVFAGWYGGYLDGDSWRLNSGIKKVKEDPEGYFITGSGQSTYYLHRNCEGMTGLMGDLLQTWEKHSTVKIEICGIGGISE